MPRRTKLGLPLVSIGSGLAPSDKALAAAVRKTEAVLGRPPGTIAPFRAQEAARLLGMTRRELKDLTATGRIGHVLIEGIAHYEPNHIATYTAAPGKATEGHTPSARATELGLGDLVRWLTANHHPSGRLAVDAWRTQVQTDLADQLPRLVLLVLYGDDHEAYQAVGAAHALGAYVEFDNGAWKIQVPVPRATAD